MSSAKRVSLESEIRKDVGRKKAKKLRREGKIPANVFGKNIKSQSLAIEKTIFEKLFRKIGETALIDLSVKGEKTPRPVLVTDVQRDPVSDHIIHVDFHQVDLTQKVTADIPIRIIGEAPAVKDKGAVLVTVLSSISVEALPTDLPEHLDIDVSTLVEFGNGVHVKDLKIDRTKVKLMVSEDETVATVQQPKEEVAETPTTPVVVEGSAGTEGVAPVEGEKKTESGKAEGKPAEKKTPANEKK